MIILDSSAIIELIKGTEQGKEIVKLIEHETVGITTMSINEVLLGAKDKYKLFLKEFFKSVHIFPFDEEAAYKSIDVEESLKKKGRPIGKIDILIAATCINYGIPLITCDKDFTNIQELKVILIEKPKHF